MELARQEASEVQREGSPLDGLAPAVLGALDLTSGPEILRSLSKVLDRVEVLTRRMEDVEEVLLRLRGDAQKARKAIRRLKDSSAKAKDIKKLKKLLDQLDVIDVGPEDCRSARRGATSVGAFEGSLVAQGGD